MKITTYTNDYGIEEKCYICNGNYNFVAMDQEEPLLIYKCTCGKIKYKSTGDYYK